MSVSFMGLTTHFLISTEAAALVEHELAPRALGAPVHTHAREDEASHVTAGRLGVRIGDEVREAGPGETVVKPRGIPHTFWNAGDEPVRFLELITPGGFERYFRDVAPLLDGPAPDPAALGAVMARYGLAMDFGSVPELIGAHDLVPVGSPVT